MSHEEVEMQKIVQKGCFSDEFSVSDKSIIEYCQAIKDANLGSAEDHERKVHPPLVPGNQTASLGFVFSEEVYRSKVFHKLLEHYEFHFRIGDFITNDVPMSISLDLDKAGEKKQNFMEIKAVDKLKGLEGKLIEKRSLCADEITEDYFELPFIQIKEKDVAKLVQSLSIVKYNEKTEQDQNPVYKLLLGYTSWALKQSKDMLDLHMDPEKRYIYLNQVFNIFPEIMDKKIGDKIIYFVNSL